MERSCYGINGKCLLCIVSTISGSCGTLETWSLEHKGWVLGFTYTCGSLLCPMNPDPYHMDNVTELLILVPERLNPGSEECSGEASTGLTLSE